MSEQTFTIAGIPKAQGRPRFARMGKFVRAYDPADSRHYKDNVSAQIVAQGPKLFDRESALCLYVVFTLPRPKGHYGAKGIRASAPTEHLTKPDVDNMLKGVMDAFKGIVWVDDTQVVSIEARKVYGETPGVAVRITEVAR